MKLRNFVPMTALFLSGAVFSSGELYAQVKKKEKTCSKKETCAKSCSKTADYGKPSDVKANEGTFKIVPLKYDYNAVDSYIDAQTMFIHFSKHYVGYLNNLNKAVEGKPQAGQSIEQVLKGLDMSNATLRNNAGGYYNHNMYFDVISPKGGGQPTGVLAEAINLDFGSFENFKKLFSEAGAKRFGSGWAWLVVKDGKLQIGSTANQDNPLMPGLEISGQPILGMDVWEHAYYLKYQNKRGDYVTNFFNVIDWERVAELYKAAIK
ncbi:superoxide dismutase [Capnocytophaga stomatis]|uniref:superoxide dismutase n=1 Tax=Capnocytophaga stomatis TaxID=1848904 RepID=UPI001A50806A|nr:superoxide dismutase [Capnocytophaga stomatis]GIJ97337.1 superoxide dismutase [Capnocytophaga stomatis]